ncbi:MAG TPA: lysophospholipid acyltransferase family protein [Polyangiaceae bacterium]
MTRRKGKGDGTRPPAAKSARRSPRAASVPPPSTPAGATETVLDAAPMERPSDPDVGARIRELEARLDKMIDAHARERESGAELEPVATRAELRPPMSSRPPPPEPDGMFDTARELLSTDFYLRKWGRLGLRNRSEDVDEFGYDPVYEQKVLPFFDFLYDRYFRVEAHGAERVPADGRCLLVANHSGTLPFDGMMLRLAVRREHPQHRDVRWLAEDAIFHFPFLGSFSNRLGAVRACQENAERLLDHGALVASFPEGMKGIGKLFKDRYRLQRFGRGGFVKLCLRTRTPVVPVAIVGGEETNPMLSRVEYLTKALGIPYLPVTPTFPLLGPLGLLPAPTKWKIVFGDPVDLEGYGAEAADDEILVGRLAEAVRREIQGMLDRMVTERRSVWFG